MKGFHGVDANDDSDRFYLASYKQWIDSLY